MDHGRRKKNYSCSSERESNRLEAFETGKLPGNIKEWQLGLDITLDASVSWSIPAGEMIFLIEKPGFRKLMLSRLLRCFCAAVTCYIMFDCVVVEALRIIWLNEDATLFEQRFLLLIGPDWNNIAIWKGKQRYDTFEMEKK